MANPEIKHGLIPEKLNFIGDFIAPRIGVSSSKSIFVCDTISTYSTLETCAEWGGNDQKLIDYVRSKDRIVILDLFAGRGYVPLYLLYWLAKHQAILPETTLGINTVTLFSSPSYTTENLPVITSGKFIEHRSQRESEEDNQLLADGTLNGELLSRVSVHHYHDSVFKLIQRVPDQSVDFVTAFNCSEAFSDSDLDTYFRRRLDNHEIDWDGMEKDLELAKKIRNEHFGRVLRPGGFLLQVGGCGLIPGLSILGRTTSWIIEYPVLSRKNEK